MRIKFAIFSDILVAHRGVFVLVVKPIGLEKMPFITTTSHFVSASLFDIVAHLISVINSRNSGGTTKIWIMSTIKLSHIDVIRRFTFVWPIPRSAAFMIVIFIGTFCSHAEDGLRPFIPSLEVLKSIVFWAQEIIVVTVGETSRTSETDKLFLVSHGVSDFITTEWIVLWTGTSPSFVLVTGRPPRASRRIFRVSPVILTITIVVIPLLFVPKFISASVVLALSKIGDGSTVSEGIVTSPYPIVKASG